MTAGSLAEESGLTTGAVTFILDRLEEAGMVTVGATPRTAAGCGSRSSPRPSSACRACSSPWPRRCARWPQRFKADELAIVRDFMRQAKEVFQRQVAGPAKGDPGLARGPAGGRAGG